MKSSTNKTIETISNVVIILVVLIVGAVFLKTYFFNKNTPAIVRPAIGSALNISGEDFGGNNKNLIIALQQGCHYCAESVPFYRQIIAGAQQKKDVHLLVLLPQDNNPQYIKDLQLDISDVKLASFSSYHIGATPTLILVDPQAKITNVWMGKLSPAIEAEVMKTLDLDCDQCVVKDGK